MSTGIKFDERGCEVSGDRASAVEDVFRDRNRIQLVMEQFGVTEAHGETYHGVMNDIFRQGAANGHKPCGLYPE
jgi:hypothetical protein